MASIAFKRDEIILLLGAGASVEAGIPDSNAMVKKVAELIRGNDDWECYESLYNYVRSSIYYAEGIKGKFDSAVQFNIETLVNVLDEIQRKENHTLYPFVGAWNPKLVEIAGSDFENVGKLLRAILRVLRDEWVVLPNYGQAAYYSGLSRFQQEYGYPLRVFSLNYDLCVELTCGPENVQRGFSGNRSWDWRLFDETLDDAMPISLYKLHGSVDWHFDENDMVTYSDSPSTIRTDDVAMIFGTSYKLQYVDPFLLLAYELRRWTLDSARLIISVGYGFNDEHINGILEQSLRQDASRKLLAIIGPSDENSVREQSTHITERLKADPEQIEIKAWGAREFLEERLTIENLQFLFPSEPDLMPELPPSAEDSRAVAD